MHVTRFAEEWGTAIGTERIHLDHLMSGGPAQDVEVVNVAIAEDAPGCGDVRAAWWRLVASK